MSPEMDSNHHIDADRRAFLAGFAALLAAPGAGLLSAGEVAAKGNWTLATQIIAGTQLPDPTVLTIAVEALEKEVGADVVTRLHAAILRRDAADIVEPFEAADVEAAARRFVEMIYTGEFESGDTAGYHTALAWKVLRFTKPPSVCGPDMGWWTDPPSLG